MIKVATDSQYVKVYDESIQSEALIDEDVDVVDVITTKEDISVGDNLITDNIYIVSLNMSTVNKIFKGYANKAMMLYPTKTQLITIPTAITGLFVDFRNLYSIVLFNNINATYMTFTNIYPTSLKIHMHWMDEGQSNHYSYIPHSYDSTLDEIVSEPVSPMENGILQASTFQIKDAYKNAGYLWDDFTITDKTISWYMSKNTIDDILPIIMTSLGYDATTHTKNVYTGDIFINIFDMKNSYSYQLLYPYITIEADDDSWYCVNNSTISEVIGKDDGDYIYGQFDRYDCEKYEGTFLTGNGDTDITIRLADNPYYSASVYTGHISLNLGNIFTTDRLYYYTTLSNDLALWVNCLVFGNYIFSYRHSNSSTYIYYANTSFTVTNNRVSTSYYGWESGWQGDNGTYAITSGFISGAYGSETLTNVIMATNSSLTTTTKSVLSTARCSSGIIRAGNYALIIGGYATISGYGSKSNAINIVDAINQSLTRSSAPALDYNYTSGRLLYFNGCGFVSEYSYNKDAYYYNSSLTKSVAPFHFKGDWNDPQFAVGGSTLYWYSKTSSRTISTYNSSLTKTDIQIPSNIPITTFNMAYIQNNLVMFNRYSDIGYQLYMNTSHTFSVSIHEINSLRFEDYSYGNYGVIPVFSNIYLTDGENVLKYNV
jgi:hypothetical protein